MVGHQLAVLKKYPQSLIKLFLKKEKGNDIIVVVSAMSGETNRLIELAKSIDKDVNGREYDVLISTGEQVTISLLAMTLIKKGHKAISLTGQQAGIITDSIFNKARIESIDKSKIKKHLDSGYIVIVAGFQGLLKEVT